MNNNTKKIAWVSHNLGKSQRVLDALKANGFTGLIINIAEYDGDKYLPEYDLITRANLHDFPDSLLSLGTGMWRDRQALYPEIKKFYIDEPKTTTYNGRSCWFTNDVPLQLLFNRPENYLFGEPSILVLENYKHLTCQVTYSSYRKYWLWVEKLFGWRIPRYGNQIWAWKKLMILYGYLPTRFNHCWINLQLNKNHFPKLIKWCEDHQKTIMLYCEWEVSEEDFLRQLQEFTKHL